MENPTINTKTINEAEMSSPRLKTNIFVYLTILIHIFVVSFTTFILYLCFSNDVVLFTWHPVLLTIGWLLLMSEGILVFNPNNALVTYFSYKTRIRMHWVVQGIGSVSCVIGFIIIYVNKNLNNKLHFQTWHGVLGLISTITLVMAVLTGIVALYSFSIRNYVSLANSKFAHRVIGAITFLIAGITILVGLYTHWFQRKVNQGITIMWLVILIVTFAWCLNSGFTKIVRRIKQLA